jgi:hypothetical protein
MDRAGRKGTSKQPPRLSLFSECWLYHRRRLRRRLLCAMRCAITPLESRSRIDGIANSSLLGHSERIIGLAAVNAPSRADAARGCITFVTFHLRPRATRAFRARNLPQILTLFGIISGRLVPQRASRGCFVRGSIAIDYAPSNLASPEAAAERNFSPALVFAAASEKPRARTCGFSATVHLGRIIAAYRFSDRSFSLGVSCNAHCFYSRCE